MKTTDCHPDKPHHAKGLCRSCYTRLWRQANRQQAALIHQTWYYGPHWPQNQRISRERWRANAAKNNARRRELRALRQRGLAPEATGRAR